jgi:hypothetical protein
LEGRLIKVGTGDSVSDRLKHLRAEAYGGFSDWVVLAETRTIPAAGKVERAVQTALAGYSRTSTYIKGEREQRAKELFACNFATAAHALLKELGDPSLLHRMCDLTTAKRYEWP